MIGNEGNYTYAIVNNKDLIRGQKVFEKSLKDTIEYSFIKLTIAEYLYFISDFI